MVFGMSDRSKIRFCRILLVCQVVLCLGILLGGCSWFGNRTVYRYRKAEVVEGFILTKSVYEEGKLTMYTKSDLSDGYKVYDSSNHMTDYEITEDRVVISAENVSEITELTISNGATIYQLRYLNTDQYAVLAYVSVCDGPNKLIGGDVNDYYTQEELDFQIRLKEEKQAMYDACWAVLEGCYESENGDVIEFYVDDVLGRVVSMVDHSFDIVSISNAGNQYYVLCQGGYMQYDFDCEISEECICMSFVTFNRDLKKDVTYYRTDEG